VDTAALADAFVQSEISAAAGIMAPRGGSGSTRRSDLLDGPVAEDPALLRAGLIDPTSCPRS
jgi:hypothetical protein